MKLFLAGSTGVIGRRLLPLLTAAGHEVTALTRSAANTPQLRAHGAHVAVADAFDREALTAAIRDAQPDIVIHQLTALSGGVDFKNLDQSFTLTNRLRTEVTDTMLAAAQDSGAGRFIVQSFCGWPFARQGGPVKSEADPLDTDPPAGFEETLAAIRYLEDAVRHAGGIEALALRYGFFYGPGTAIAAEGEIVEMVRTRRFPLVGGGGGIWSFIHIEDAARTTVAALTGGEPGIYNVVDDEPAPVSAWLPFLAEAIGARPPWRIPAWLARFVIGQGGVMMMTEIRGGSNAKARRELDWQPTYPSWRQGFVTGLG